MANISNRLKGLFNDYLNRLECEKNSSSTSSYPPCRNPYYSRPPMSTPHQQRIDFKGSDDDFNGVITFYEWSGSNSTPRSFFTLYSFETFLNTSQIFMASYQKELIKHLEKPFIACKKGCKDLIIKSNYESLKKALDENDTTSSNKGSEDREPYNVGITRLPFNGGVKKPMLIFEQENRWDEMHPEVGGCWGW